MCQTPACPESLYLCVCLYVRLFYKGLFPFTQFVSFNLVGYKLCVSINKRETARLKNKQYFVSFLSDFEYRYSLTI